MRAPLEMGKRLSITKSLKLSLISLTYHRGHFVLTIWPRRSANATIYKIHQQRQVI